MRDHRVGISGQNLHREHAVHAVDNVCFAYDGAYAVSFLECPPELCLARTTMNWNHIRLLEPVR